MKVIKNRANDLVYRLRKRGLSSGGTLGHHSGLCDEAADLIEELIAKLDSTTEIKVSLPNGKTMRAVAYQDDVNPAIDIYLGEKNENPLCFAEYNTDKPDGQNVCVCAYKESQEDSVYYAPYCS